MDISLKIFAFIVILCYFIIVLGFLRKKKFDLKYSLLWLLAGIIMILVVAIIWVTGMMGVKVASNGIFAICILLEIVIMISMTAALSDFANRIKILTQNIAILENRIRKLEEQIKYESKKTMKQRMSQQRNKRQCH